MNTASNIVLNTASNTASLSAETVQLISRLAGLDLTPERANALLPGLEPIFRGDAELVRLELGTLSPLGVPGSQVLGE